MNNPTTNECYNEQFLAIKSAMLQRTQMLKQTYFYVFIMEHSIIVFTRERSFMLFICFRFFMLFIRESLFIVFTMETLFMLFKFMCSV